MIKEFLDYAPIKGRVERDIQELLNSEYPCCEIDTTLYKNASAARSTYASAIRKKSIKGVRTVMVRNRVYLVKEL